MLFPTLQRRTRWLGMPLVLAESASAWLSVALVCGLGPALRLRALSRNGSTLTSGLYESGVGDSCTTTARSYSESMALLAAGGLLAPSSLGPSDAE